MDRASPWLARSGGKNQLMQLRDGTVHMKSFAKLCCVAGLLLLFRGANVASAQDVLVDLYGKGVHQYFAGCYMPAIENFSSSIDNGSKDPRNYYFRGLARARMGMCDAATDDWENGARVEMEDANGLFAVGRALERIQGAERLQIEKYRREAKLQAQLERKMRASMPVQTMQPDAAVLRNPNWNPNRPSAEVVPAKPALVNATPAADEPAANPFGDEPAAPTAKGTKPAEPAADDIFGN
jgi:hypothetical protein